MVKIAVLMSTYNGEKYIKEQIESILNQKGDFLVDLIVRDDGSNDSTLEILHEYEQEKKLRFYQGKNLKAAKSFMDLVINSEGYDYYAFSDQDDFWYENKLSKGIEKIKNVDIPAIAFSNGELVDECLQSLGRNVYTTNVPPTNFESVVINGGVQGCTMIWNEKLSKEIRKKGMPSVVGMHDAYVARVCTAIGGMIFYEETPLIKYRQHGSNVLGIPITIKEKIVNRLRCIFTEDKISLSSQVQEIMRLYQNEILPENMVFLKKVVDYKSNLKDRLNLVTSKNISYSSYNMGITMKLKILFRNR